MSIPNYYRPVYSEKEREKYNLFNDMQNRYQTMSKKYVPTTVNAKEYDSSKLENVGKDANALQDLQDQIETRQAAERDAVEKAQSEKDAKNATRMDDDEDGSWLSMIFQIVPIGINVLRKGPVLARGFNEMINGLIGLVNNLAITAVILFRDTFVFTGHAFYYVFTLLLCGVYNMFNLHKCIMFYLFDLFLFCLKMIIISLLFVIDVFFSIRFHTGISAVEMFYLALEFIHSIDELIYELTQIHVLSYPVFVIKLCYRCEMMGDTTKFQNARDDLGYDVTVRVPEVLGTPFGIIASGIRNIGSIFQL